jgi:hypothetical protein
MPDKGYDYASISIRNSPGETDPNKTREEPLNFAQLNLRMTTYLRECIRRGELTERGLARATGISQPHIHNVLKGKRVLSGELADEILRKLHLDLKDFIRAD